MFTNEEAKQLAESIYQSWKAGDTASDRWNWFMVRMDETDLNLCHKRVERDRNMVAATYTSVWDGGIEVTTPCQYCPETKTCTDIEDSGVDGVENLEDEYVTLADGTELREKDGVTFEY